MLSYILFVAGFFFLFRGAALLVDGSVSVASHLKVSNIVIGLTIVAFGTSVPELIVNVYASNSNHPGIAIGNVLGSNIANILLILGMSAIIYPLSVQRNTTYKEIPFSLLAAVVLFFLVKDYGSDSVQKCQPILSHSDGFILIAFFTIFMFYVFGISKPAEFESQPIKLYSTGKSTIFIVAGLILLGVGGHWIVNGAVNMATALGIDEDIIGLTIVAIGTSLPELATSIVAARKKNTDIAVGNVVGSNIFNIFWVLGLSAIINPLAFNLKNNIDIGLTIFVSLLLVLLLIANKKHQIERWHGVLFVVMYCLYSLYLYSGVSFIPG